ncbi:MAG: ZIP family metal transporter [Cyclobacteriaceae bacterium]
MKMLILFFAPLLAGLLIYLVPKARNSSFKLLLVFAGSYLFAITVIHILPELYREYAEVELIGLFVLLGFFLQQLLEYFTSGIEHGHIHTHDNKGHTHSHSHAEVSALVLLSALCVHAFLEGGMLAQPSSHTFHSDTNAILLGIVLHRAPAAFALMAVLSEQLRSKRRAIPYLVVFSLAAPLGLFISEYFVEINLLSETGLIFLYALVTGNFLHISTTIVFESSPDHHFNARKLAVAIVGSLVAVAVEYMF